MFISKQIKPCQFCPHCKKVTAFDGFAFRGCFEPPYKGKQCIEIRECPLLALGSTPEQKDEYFSILKNKENAENELYLNFK